MMQKFSLGDSPFPKPSQPKGSHFDGIDIYGLKIDTKISSRFVNVAITSCVVNHANVSKEAFFEVDFPKAAFVTNFTVTIDGVVYQGVIKEKKAAQQQYQKAVSRGQTAGLVKISGRNTDKFTVSVNAAAGSKITFDLAYEELLKRKFGKYEVVLKVNPKQLVQQFEIKANIYVPQGINFLEAEGSFITNDLLPVVKKSFSGKIGRVSFKPTFDQQRTCPDCPTTRLNGDFIITYDANRESPGDIKIVDGYFVHFFAPQNISRLPKNIVFIIDVSISMSGRKLQQVIKYSVESFFNLIQFFYHRSRYSIIIYPELLSVKLRTNLNGGLMAGIEMLNEAHKEGYLPERSASIIIMLTDGRPTKGERDTNVILSNVKNAIQGRYPLYNLGFGNDLDYGSLEKLAAENNGLARRIYEDSDSALQLQGFYDEVANPLLTEIELKYPENAVSDVTQNNFKHYYDGSEIVVAGRLANKDINNFTAEVKAHGAEEDLLFSEQSEIEEIAKYMADEKFIYGDYIELIWSYLTIKELLEKRDAAEGDEKANLTKQIVELSVKYLFVTPLTSVVVTEPEDNEELLSFASPQEGRSPTTLPPSPLLSLPPSPRNPPQHPTIPQPLLPSCQACHPPCPHCPCHAEPPLCCTMPRHPHHAAPPAPCDITPSRRTTTCHTTLKFTFYTEGLAGVCVCVSF
uniref:Uncharacterized protein n=1 Tax=Salvator merianae TaxID=96440 RepID=A0A8D0C8T0_SALMN